MTNSARIFIHIHQWNAEAETSSARRYDWTGNTYGYDKATAALWPVKYAGAMRRLTERDLTESPISVTTIRIATSNSPEEFSPVMEQSGVLSLGLRQVWHG